MVLNGMGSQVRTKKKVDAILKSTKKFIFPHMLSHFQFFLLTSETSVSNVELLQKHQVSTP